MPSISTAVAEANMKGISGANKNKGSARIGGGVGEGEKESKSNAQ